MMTVSEVAQKLNVSEPTVYARSKAASWSPTVSASVRNHPDRGGRSSSLPVFLSAGKTRNATEVRRPRLKHLKL